MRYRHTALLGLLGLIVLVVACAPLAAIAPAASKGSASNQLTIIYTGYGRGSVDPSSPCG